MEEVLTFKKKFAAQAGLVAAPLLVLFLALGRMDLATGLALGGAVSVLCFWAHGKTLVQAFNNTGRRAKLQVFLNYLVRYILYFLTLAIMLQRSEWYFLGAALGLLLPRIVILFFHTFSINDLRAVVKSNQE